MEIRRGSEAVKMVSDKIAVTMDGEEKMILEGVKTFLVRQLDQSNRWKRHSMQHIVLLKTDPPIDFAAEAQSETASYAATPSNVDVVVEDEEEELVLVTEGSEDDNNHEDKDEEDVENRNDDSVEVEA